MSVVCLGKYIVDHQKIKIHTDDGVYEGIVKVAQDKRIVLCQVKSVTTNKTYTGFQTFFVNEISQVEILESPENNLCSEIVKHEATNNSQAAQFVLNLKAKENNEYTDEEYNDNVNEKSHAETHLTFINNLDADFNSAVEYIKSKRVIGVATEGLKANRNGNFCLLQIDTSKTVFVFDMIENGTEFIRNGLGDILNNKKILKVFHNCREFSGVLSRQCGVKLENVFDTQVADAILHKMNSGNLPKYVRSLSNCLIDLLSLDLNDVSSQRIREGFEVEDQLVWQKRPLCLNLVYDAVKNVVYLRQLRTVLLQELNSEVTRGTEIYLNAFKYSRDSSEEHLLPRQFASMANIRNKPRGQQKNDKMQFDENGFFINKVRNPDRRLRFNRDACHMERETTSLGAANEQEILKAIQNAKEIEAQGKHNCIKRDSVKKASKSRSKSLSCSNNRRSQAGESKNESQKSGSPTSVENTGSDLDGNKRKSRKRGPRIRNRFGTTTPKADCASPNESGGRQIVNNSNSQPFELRTNSILKDRHGISVKLG